VQDGDGSHWGSTTGGVGGLYVGQQLFPSQYGESSQGQQLYPLQYGDGSHLVSTTGTTGGVGGLYVGQQLFPSQ